VASNALATAKEAFAAVPFIRAVQIVAVERREGMVRRAKLVPLCFFRVRRSEFDAVDWSKPAFETLEGIEGVLVDACPDNSGMGAIDLEDEQDVRDIVREVAEALECRS
jgi:hypothetical protein